MINTTIQSMLPVLRLKEEYCKAFQKSFPAQKNVSDPR